MYLGNFHKFQCDFCQQIELTQTFPKDWFWIKKGIGNHVGHTCPNCKDNVPPDKLKKKGDKN